MSDNIQMDSKAYTSSMESADDSAMTPVNQGELGENPDDVLARRLKNRERQRRYRARKRLQADKKKAVNTNITNLISSPPPPLTFSPVTLSVGGGEDRILCKRKWKQDARNAHVAKQQFIANGLVVKSENDLDNNSLNKNDSERKAVLGRRHWKADARNKKA